MGNSGIIGVKKDVWDAAVNKSNTAVEGITNIKLTKISKTNAKSVKDTFKMSDEIDQILNSYKTVANTYFDKMHQAGDNIVAEDKSAAQSFINNTERTKF
ncbi:MAG: hypothetical protein LBM02_06270 [Lachnospiraceae bacterium]|jgi:hypothetical protein|nr:hypothetical protein [Lachnospiraceae bacterium]